MSVYLRLLRGAVSVVRKSAWAVSKKQKVRGKPKPASHAFILSPRSTLLPTATFATGRRGTFYKLSKKNASCAHRVQARVAAIDKMVAVGVDLHLKLLIGLYQSFRVFGTIAVVYIIVGRTVNEQ